jgi:hypothetical protein
MYHLRQCMYARIGAARAMHSDFCAQKCCQRTFQRILNAATIRLRLPATELAAIVFQPQRYPHNCLPLYLRLLPTIIVSATRKSIRSNEKSAVFRALPVSTTLSLKVNCQNLNPRQNFAGRFALCGRAFTSNFVKNLFRPVGIANFDVRFCEFKFGRRSRTRTAVAI